LVSKERKERKREEYVAWGKGQWALLQDDVAGLEVAQREHASTHRFGLLCASVAGSTGLLCASGSAARDDNAVDADAGFA
jgi:hypothetical protein